ncbi:MAG: DUF4954 family protein [Rikenellaceae bacterium]
MELRAITPDEQMQLTLRGCMAEDWSQIKVSDSFSVSQLYMSRFEGKVELHAGARVYNSTIINYTLHENVIIDRVDRLECSGVSSFGNGVEVSSLNECGGRKIKIYESMTAQVAYLATIYCHRPQLISRIEKMAEEYAKKQSSSIGSIGKESKIMCAGILRNIKAAESVTIEGASSLSNGTLLSGAYVGADVKAHDFIAVEGSRIDNGAILERCFVGESAIISNGFTAVDSLFFALTHCENGEAASIFAGPYTVSHHKSTLLIAGMFSFFNAGSGSNQSNHLFKCGPVHQGIHLRGCKFGSGAYVMLPALDGAFTTVVGSHYTHHDTSKFPFSMLIKKGDHSTLIPASNLISYGYIRDVEKWIKRDKRTVKRDIINMEEYNPYLLGALIDAVNVSNKLLDENAEAENYTYNKLQINGDKLRQGVLYYNKAIAASLGAILSRGDNSRQGEGRCRWLDIAGQYITQRAVDAIIEGVELGTISTLDAIDSEFKAFASEMDAYAFDYAFNILGELLGHTPSAEEIEMTRNAKQRSEKQLLDMAHIDMLRDSSSAMKISYGADNPEDEQVKTNDFNAVRGV